MAAIFLMTSGPAAAVTYQVRVEGTILTEGTDPNLGIGDKVIMTARFDSSRSVKWGEFDYNVASLKKLPVTGGQFFRIEANGNIWKSSDLYMPEGNFFQSDNFVDDIYFGFGYPAVIFNNEHVIGLAGDLWDWDSPHKPELYLLSSVDSIAPEAPYGGYILKDHKEDGTVYEQSTFLDWGSSAYGNSQFFSSLGPTDYRTRFLIRAFMGSGISITHP